MISLKLLILDMQSFHFWTTIFVQLEIFLIAAWICFYLFKIDSIYLLELLIAWLAILMQKILIQEKFN
jgi:hypothetical protein